MIITSALVSLIIFTDYKDNYKYNKKCISPNDLHEKVEKRIVKITAFKNNKAVGTGTGLLLDDLSVKTSTHVINEYDNFIVKIKNKEYKYKKHKIGRDDSISSLKPINDIKDLNINDKLSYSTVGIGETIYSIGYPYGDIMRFTHGFVSSLDNYIHTDMIMHPGMSGSPVFDCEANVVGYVLGYYSISNNFGVVNFYYD